MFLFQIDTLLAMILFLCKVPFIFSRLYDLNLGSFFFTEFHSSSQDFNLNLEAALFNYDSEEGDEIDTNPIS